MDLSTRSQGQAIFGLLVPNAGVPIGETSLKMLGGVTDLGSNLVCYRCPARLAGVSRVGFCFLLRAMDLLHVTRGLQRTGFCPRLVALWDFGAERVPT